MTRLRQCMLQDLQRRNYSPDTIRGYIRAVQQFAEYFGRSPERLGAAELRRYQLYLLHEKKLALGTVENCISALRFLYKGQMDMSLINTSTHEVGTPTRRA